VQAAHGIRSFLLGCGCKTSQGDRKALCSDASLPMWGKIFDAKLQKIGREADKQTIYALTLSSRCSHSLNLYYTPTYDASLGKSICSALAQQMFLQRFLSIDLFVAEYCYRKK
jgi:hypothetical protein